MLNRGVQARLSAVAVIHYDYAEKVTLEPRQECQRSMFREGRLRIFQSIDFTRQDEAYHIWSGKYIIALRSCEKIVYGR